MGLQPITLCLGCSLVGCTSVQWRCCSGPETGSSACLETSVVPYEQWSLDPSLFLRSFLGWREELNSTQNGMQKIKGKKLKSRFINQGLRIWTLWKKTCWFWFPSHNLGQQCNVTKKKLIVLDKLPEEPVLDLMRSQGIKILVAWVALMGHLMSRAGERVDRRWQIALWILAIRVGVRHVALETPCRAKTSFSQGAVTSGRKKEFFFLNHSRGQGKERGGLGHCFDQWVKTLKIRCHGPGMSIAEQRQEVIFLQRHLAVVEVGNSD